MKYTITSQCVVSIADGTADDVIADLVKSGATVISQDKNTITALIPVRTVSINDGFREVDGL